MVNNAGTLIGVGLTVDSIISLALIIIGIMGCLAHGPRYLTSLPLTVKASLVIGGSFLLFFDASYAIFQIAKTDREIKKATRTLKSEVLEKEKEFLIGVSEAKLELNRAILELEENIHSMENQQNSEVDDDHPNSDLKATDMRANVKQLISEKLKDLTQLIQEARNNLNELKELKKMLEEAETSNLDSIRLILTAINKVLKK